MNKKVIIVSVIISLMVISMGCTTTGNTHEPYSQVIIIEKFSQTQSTLTTAFGYEFSDYNYYIRYKTNGGYKVDRISKDTYSSVFEGNIYVLKWGYINDANCIEKGYGYVGVISQVAP
jgi:amino acid permease